MIAALPGEIAAAPYDGVRALSPRERDAALTRLELPAEPPSLAALTRLQWAMLRMSPFHNIELLAGRLGFDTALDVEACIDRMLRGHGGPCHVQATAFLALLRSLDYRAHFAAATVGAPSDHFVVVVRFAGTGYVCDVGNGHPYDRPFPLASPLAFDRFGWRFSTAVDPEKLVLRRHTGLDEWKIVYRVDPAPRTFADFTEIVRQHHTRPGFGPFLTGLRAVRITERAMLTLRDSHYQRHTRLGATDRPVPDEQAALALLRGPFGLNGLPLEIALEALRQSGCSPWGGARVTASEALRSPSQILVSLATTDRPAALGRLGDGLVDELERRGYGGWPHRRHVELLVIENSTAAASRQENRAIAQRLASRGLEIEWVDDAGYGRPIGESRLRQVQAIIARQRRGKRDDAWWMIDDDVAFGQLTLDTSGVVRTVHELDYFAAIDRYQRERPELSMVLGGVTGDPPIRPEAVIRVQLFDILANLEWFASLAPDERYRIHARQTGYRLSDYYYDHRREGAEHLTVPFLWLPRGRRDGNVVDEMTTFLEDATGIAWGRSITRPLLVGTAALPSAERPCCRRGGNTVFLDWDTLLEHTYPSFRVGGAWTRRSDMVGASLLVGAGDTGIVEVSLPLLHQRVVEGPFPSREAARSSLLAEFFGVLTARVVMEKSRPRSVTAADLARLAADRSELVVEQLRVAGQLAERVLARLVGRRGAWWETHPRTVGPAQALYSSVNELLEGLLGGRSGHEREIWLESLRAELRSEDHIATLTDGLATLDAQIDAHRSQVDAWIARGAS